MSGRARTCLPAGLALLLGAWVWPLPALGLPPFTAHMTAHMLVVAVAAPLLTLGVAGARHDPTERAPRLFSAIPVSAFELVCVWAWHAPALHALARGHTWALALEQTMFLAAGVWLWLSALGGSAARRRSRAAEGIAGLLLTSMHMTLLGALIALTDRSLFRHAHAAHAGLSPLQDQHLGGAVMLLLGGVAYLLGGLGLLADVLRGDRPVEVRS